MKIGEIISLCFYPYSFHKDPHIQQQGLRKDRGTFRRGEKEEDKMNGEEIMIKIT